MAGATLQKFAIVPMLQMITAAPLMSHRVIVPTACDTTSQLPPACRVSPRSSTFSQCALARHELWVRHLVDADWKSDAASCKLQT